MISKNDFSKTISGYCLSNSPLDLATQNYSNICLFPTEKPIRLLRLNRTKEQEEAYSQSEKIKKQRELANIYNIRTDCHAILTFEKMRRTIKKKIINQIHNLSNPRRCVLILSSDYNLATNVALYIYYTHSDSFRLNSPDKFSMIECLGWDENRIKNEIIDEDINISKTIYNNFMYKTSKKYISIGNQYKIKEFLEGNTLFLRDVEERNSLKQLAGIIRSRASGNHGMLIVSVPSIDKLTEEIVSQFDVIRIGHEKRKSNDLGVQSRKNSERQVNDEATYNWSIKNKKNIYSNGKLVARLPEKPLKLFTCLYDKEGEFVERKILQKACLGEKETNNVKYVAEAVCKLRKKLKKGLKYPKVEPDIEIIVPQTTKSNKAFKLLP